MRVEELSNHPLTRVRSLRAAIADAERRRSEHLSQVDRLSAGNAAARRWWQWLRWWRDLRQETRMRLAAPTVDPATRAELARFEAGSAAESRAAEELIGAFPDDWALFLGYANRRGEVDIVLVGPGGVWAAEVKGRGVRVHVHGDEWTFDKFDRYGNHVDAGRLNDRGGRSWGRQVSDIAGELEAFLRKRHVSVTVRPVVLLMHERAEIGTCVDLRVDLAVGTEALVEWAHGAPRALSRRDQADLERLIRQDHAFHARRGRGRGRRHP